MKYRSFIYMAVLCMAACTFDPGNVNDTSHLHLPLTYEPWQTDHYSLKDGTKACSISSGYNGITILLGARPGSIEVAARSNRYMEPTDTFKVLVAGHMYETYGRIFSPEDAAKIKADFMQGGKAYLEWSVYGNSIGGARQHIDNTARLDGFAAKVQECENGFKSQK